LDLRHFGGGIIGEAVRPLIQVGQIIVSRFITPLTEHFDELNRIVMAHWREWISYLDRYVVPASKRLVDQGWQKLSQGIVWFQRNGSWFLPWFKRVAVAVGVWTFAIGPLVRAISLLRGALIGLSLSNPFTALAATAGLAAAYIITHWTQVKNVLGSIWEWIVGTKTFNPNLEPAGVLRAYPKGWFLALNLFKWDGWARLNNCGPIFSTGYRRKHRRTSKILIIDFDLSSVALMDWWNTNVAPTLSQIWKDITELMKTIVDHWLVGVKIGIETVINVADRDTEDRRCL
jgi:hypothetical protein